MFERFWDPEGKYKEGFLKGYKHWVLEVSYRQHTLGCYIIFAKRQGVERISELDDEELINLRKVMKEIEGALQKIEVFKPDKFNYWQMGNNLHHLHLHGIPRYKNSRFFAGREWIDATYGAPPVWSTNDVGDEVVIMIRKKIKEKLQK